MVTDASDADGVNDRTEVRISSGRDKFEAYASAAGDANEYLAGIMSDRGNFEAFTNTTALGGVFGHRGGGVNSERANIEADTLAK